MLYETLSVNVGLFYKFTLVKMEGPNKSFELKYITLKGRETRLQTIG